MKEKMYLTPFCFCFWRLVTPHPDYLALGASDAECWARYRALALRDEDAAITSELREATQQHVTFGLTRFAQQISAMLDRR